MPNFLDICVAAAILAWAALSFPVGVLLGRRLKERSRRID